MEKEFCRVRSAKDMIITSAIIASGCILAAFPESTSVNLLCFFMALTGLILIFVLKTGYMDVESGEMYCKQEKYFAQSLKSSLASAISKAPCKLNLAEEDKGIGIRLDIYYNRKNGKAYTQLFEYIPYRYEPCSCVYEHELEKLDNILKK